MFRIEVVEESQAQGPKNWWVMRRQGLAGPGWGAGRLKPFGRRSKPAFPK